MTHPYKDIIHSQGKKQSPLCIKMEVTQLIKRARYTAALTVYKREKQHTYTQPFVPEFKRKCAVWYGSIKSPKYLQHREYAQCDSEFKYYVISLNFKYNSVYSIKDNSLVLCKTIALCNISFKANFLMQLLENFKFHLWFTLYFH